VSLNFYENVNLGDILTEVVLKSGLPQVRRLNLIGLSYGYGVEDVESPSNPTSTSKSK
jgi:hypothetical protein